MGTSILFAAGLAAGLSASENHDLGTRPILVAAIPAVDDALRLIVQDDLDDAHAERAFRFPEFGNGEEALGALADGKVDLAMTTMLPLARQILADAKRDVPEEDQIVILSTLYHSPEVLSLVLDTSRGVFTPGDLAGKSVGYTDSGHQEMVLDLELNDLGLNSQDVRALPVSRLFFQHAIGQGELDAALVWPELKKRLLTRYPDRFVVFEDQVVHYNMAVLVTRRGVLERNPEQLTHYLTHLVEAEAQILHQPAAVNKRIAALLDDPQPRVTRAMARHSFQISLSESTVAALSRMVQWQSERDDQSHCQIPLRERLAPSILSEVKPGAVWMLGY